MRLFLFLFLHPSFLHLCSFALPSLLSPSSLASRAALPPSATDDNVQSLAAVAANHFATGLCRRFLAARSMAPSSSRHGRSLVMRPCRAAGGTVVVPVAWLPGSLAHTPVLGMAPAGGGASGSRDSPVVRPHSDSALYPVCSRGCRSSRQSGLFNGRHAVLCGHLHKGQVFILEKLRSSSDRLQNLQGTLDSNGVFYLFWGYFGFCWLILGVILGLFCTLLLRILKLLFYFTEYGVLVRSFLCMYSVLRILK